MGTRERAGTAFQKVNYQTLYTIYVRKADYERAVHVTVSYTHLDVYKRQVFVTAFLKKVQNLVSFGRFNEKVSTHL